MLWFTVTAPPIVEPFIYTASNSGNTTAYATAEQTQGDIYYYTNEGSTSVSNSETAQTSSNGDVLQTFASTGYSSNAGTTVDDTVDTQTSSTEITESTSTTGIQSWNGQQFNSDITEVRSLTTDYTWNTGYVTQLYTFQIAIEGGQETEATTAITGTTTTSSSDIDGESQQITSASTTSTTQSYNRTINGNVSEKQGTTYFSTTLAPITLWQTSTVMALRVSYTIPYQDSSSTIVFTQYGEHTHTQSFTDQLGTITRSYVPITDTTGATGFRNTHTVFIIPENETLWVPTATGVREASNLCQSFVGPSVTTLSGVYSTREGLVVNGDASYQITEETPEITRTITTATLNVQTTLGTGTNTYTTTGNFKTRSYSLDGIVPLFNPTFWPNPWPMRDYFIQSYNQIPAQIQVTVTESEAVTTTQATTSRAVTYGDTPTDSAVVWKETYVETQTPYSTYQKTINSFLTESYTRRYAISGGGSTSDGGETSGSTGSGAYGYTWIEHCNLSIDSINSNPLSASITYESFGQAPLSNLTQRAKKVSIENTTITAWRPAAALSSVDFVAAVFPQTFSAKDEEASRTTSGRFWADGYQETILNKDSSMEESSSTSFSGAWVAQGNPDTSWIEVGNFGNTGKNQMGNNWTRVRPPNILRQVDSLGSTTPVTHQNLSTYEATLTEEYQSVLAVFVNSTGGGQRFLAQLT